MGVRVEAVQRVVDLLDALCESSDPDDGLRCEAIEERIDLIGARPDDPLARGIQRWFESKRTLARVSTVFIPALREAWAIVWTMDPDASAIVVRHIEDVTGSA